MKKILIELFAVLFAVLLITAAFGERVETESVTFQKSITLQGAFTGAVEAASITNEPFAFTLSYGVASNDVNKIVWTSPALYDCTITGLYWYCGIGTPTGNLFIANATTAAITWDSVAYSNITWQASGVKDFAAVAIAIIKGQSIGFMASASTNVNLGCKGKRP